MDDLPADSAADPALLIQAVRQGGQLALDFFRGPLEVRQKSQNNPVSDADLAVDALLRKILIEARPDYGWLSEESPESENRAAGRFLWVVDPIDGTRAFVKGDKDFSISAALVCDGRPILGCIFAPAHDLFFEAGLGRGARLNGTPIRVSDRSDLEGARILAAKGMIRHTSWSSPWPDMRIENRSSIAYRVALVASGDFDAAVTLSPTNEWDLAAADIILSEAGGSLTNHLGEALVYNKVEPRIRSMVAAGPGLHPSVVARTRSAPLPH